MRDLAGGGEDAAVAVVDAGADAGSRREGPMPLGRLGGASLPRGGVERGGGAGVAEADQGADAQCVGLAAGVDVNVDMTLVEGEDEDGQERRSRRKAPAARSRKGVKNGTWGTLRVDMVAW